MSQPVRYGVIGAGRMAGHTMLSIMKDHPAARPVAFYEIDPRRADTAKRLPLLAERGIRSCGSLEELLSADDVDVILSATPHFAHCETTLAALKAGRAVISEKPPACSREECQRMVAAARAAGKPLMLHFQHVLRPSARWLNRLLCDGAIGAIRRVSCVSLWWRSDDYYRRVDWAGKRAFQGRPTLDGTMCNQSVHYLNQMLNLAQNTGESHVALPATMRAALYRFHAPGALEMEDTVVATGRLAGEAGTEFFFAATTCAADSAGSSRAAEYAGISDRHSIVIEGDKGRAIWAGHARVERPGKEPLVFEQPDGPWPFYFHVRDVLAGAAEPITPAEQSVKTMEFIFGAYEAAGPIRQAPWDAISTVGPELHACATARRLPAELPAPPSWAV